MQMEVDLSHEQYFEATRLSHLHTTRKRRWSFLIAWYGYPILGVVFALLTVLVWLSDQRLSSGVVFNLCATIFFLWCRFGFAARIRKMYEQQAKNFPGTMTLTPTGLRFERKNGTASTDYTWNAFEQWLERPEMLLLFPGPLSFVRIPKDMLTSAEQDEVRGWLSVASKRVE
jgi:YcxB-like protein